MSSSIETIIKIHENNIKEYQSALADLTRKQEELNDRDEQIVLSIQKEMEFTAENNMFAANLEKFNKYANHKRKIIRKNMLELDEQVSKLLESLKEEFAVLKKYEIVKERDDLEEIEFLKQQETKNLDEISSQKYINSSK